MNLARGHTSFDGEYGNKRILRVVHTVYGIGRYLTENFSRLQKQVQQLDRSLERLTAGSVTEEDFRKIRRKSRCQLRKGAISERYHQKIFRWWRQELDRLFLEKELYYIDPFFEKNFPMIVPFETRKEVLGILRNKAALEGESHE
jgi:hypothetical protein